jgi:hypothetical protein
VDEKNKTGCGLGPDLHGTFTDTDGVQQALLVSVEEPDPPRRDDIERFPT